MTFGNARLLVAVLIALGVLYLVTRNRWNWARLVRIAAVVLAILVAGIGSWTYWSSLPPTSPVVEFWNLSLGASESDVRFLKGEPAEIVDGGIWVYEADRSRTYYVVFGDNDEITQIVVAPGPGFRSGVSLLGVRPGLEVERLIDRLGEPSRVIALAEELKRVYLYEHLHAVFVLQRGQVVSFGIYDVEAEDPYREGGDDLPARRAAVSPGIEDR